MAIDTIRPGSRIAGRYRLGEELGHGGMAVVYRAHDEQLDRDVALKLVDPSLESGDDFAARLIAEARAAAALPGANVVTVFDAGEHDGRPFIVMEYVDGGDLRTLLDAEGRLAPREAARIAAGVANGLSALHARGLVHCDVKPLNVLLTREREPRLIDFGIARSVSEATAAVTRGEIFGSAPYLAPEQVRGERVGPSTDVYALGLLLYEMLAGRRAYDGRTLAEVAARRLEAPPPPLQEVTPATPPDLIAIVERALAPEPTNRFPDAAALAAALARFLDGRPEAPPPARGLPDRPRRGDLHGQTTRVVAARPPVERAAPGAAPAPRPARAGRLPWLPLVLAVLVLLGLGGLVAFGGAIRVDPPLGERVEVPPLASLSFDDAARRLSAIGLEAEKAQEQVTLDTPRGVVVTHDPPGGARVRKGERVRMLVSLGVQLPSFIGQQWDDVKPWMDANGWRLGNIRFVVADRKDFGKVVFQDPPADRGSVADKAGTPISLHIAGPPEATKTGFPRAGSAPPRRHATPARGLP